MRVRGRVQYLSLGVQPPRRHGRLAGHIDPCPSSDVCAHRHCDARTDHASGWGLAGRPRADLDARIRDATLAILAEDGYGRLTMGGAAERGGIGKPTLYRRHSSRAALVAAVLASMTAPESSAAPLPADTRGALVSLLASTATVLAAPGSMTILGSLLAQSAADPELIEAFRDAVFRPQRAVVHGTILAGIERGEVRTDMDLEAIDAMLFGSLLARAVLGETMEERWPSSILAPRKRLASPGC
jgi:AcrR family transcriptional regulator